MSYGNGVSHETRYSKDQLLDIFQNQRDAGALRSNLEDAFVGGWDPRSEKNGISQSKIDKDQYPGPEACWNYVPAPIPFGLVDMTDEEKQVCTRPEISSLLTHASSFLHLRSIPPSRWPKILKMEAATLP